MIKRLICVALLVGMLFSFTGCKESIKKENIKTDTSKKLISQKYNYELLSKLEELPEQGVTNMGLQLKYTLLGNSIFYTQIKTNSRNQDYAQLMELNINNGKISPIAYFKQYDSIILTSNKWIVFYGGGIEDRTQDMLLKYNIEEKKLSKLNIKIEEMSTLTGDNLYYTKQISESNHNSQIIHHNLINDIETVVDTESDEIRFARLSSDPTKPESLYYNVGVNFDFAFTVMEYNVQSSTKSMIFTAEQTGKERADPKSFKYYNSRIYTYKDGLLRMLENKKFIVLSDLQISSEVYFEDDCIYYVNKDISKDDELVLIDKNNKVTTMALITNWDLTNSLMFVDSSNPWFRESESKTFNSYIPDEMIDRNKNDKSFNGITKSFKKDCFCFDGVAFNSQKNGYFYAIGRPFELYQFSHKVNEKQYNGPVVSFELPDDNYYLGSKYIGELGIYKIKISNDNQI